MRKTGLLPLFLIAPLFMANSPAPWREPDLYEDFTASNLVTISHDTETGRRVYSVSITNNGDGYISYSHASIRGKGDTYIKTLTSYQEDLVIAPNKTADIKFAIGYEVTLNDIYPVMYGYLSTFEVKGAAAFSEVSAITKGEEDINSGEDMPSKYFTYSFTCKYKNNTNEFGRYYAPIFHFSDGDNDYYFHQDLLSDEYKIMTTLDLDENKLELVDYTFIQGYDYYRQRGVTTVAVSTFMWVMLALFVFSVPVVLVIGGLVILIIFIVKRKKNRGESQQTAGNNEENNS